MTNTTDEMVEDLEESTSNASPAGNEGTDLEGGESQDLKTEAPEQSDRAKSRQHELAQKLRKTADEKDALLKRLSQYEPEPYVKPILPFMPKPPSISGVRELSQQEYETEVSNKANQIVDLRVGQLEQKISRREQRATDIEYLEQRYPELKPGEGQNKALTKKVISLYQKASVSNPDLSLADYVEDVMELRTSGQTEGREEASVQMARNEAEAPLTPTASKPRGLMNEAELEKALAEGKISAKEARKYLLSEE